jgi:nucleotide-binding universal stress UspA family protein
MKKIILVFDGLNFSKGAFEFARKLNDVQRTLLVGLFLPQTSLVNLGSYAEVERGWKPLFEGFESKTINQNIDRFEKLCVKNGIEHRVHKDFYDLAMPEIKKESEYADLLILGSEKFYESTGVSSPNSYLRTALHDIKCPVILVPEIFDFPENVILAYDGTEQSAYPIKQFAYLFPEMSEKPTLLVYASKNPAEDFPGKGQIEELVARHFHNLTLLKLDINPKKFFGTWLSENNSAILVSGSYGRSTFSQLLKKSFVAEIIAERQLPVFIAHR